MDWNGSRTLIGAISKLTAFRDIPTSTQNGRVMQNHTHTSQTGEGAHLESPGECYAHPPIFQLTADGDPDENPNEHDDLTGKRSLVNFDTRLFSKPDHHGEHQAIDRNTEIFVIQDGLGYDWAKVRVVETQEIGFMNRNYIHQTKTGVDPGAILYHVDPWDTEKAYPNIGVNEYILAKGSPKRVDRLVANRDGIRKAEDGTWYRVLKTGDTLEGIIKAQYPERKDSNADLRTIANVILFVNNPTNDTAKGIYVESDGDHFEKWLHGIGHNYQDIVIKGDHDILLPSWESVLQKRDQVKSGSLSAGLVSSLWPDGFGAHFTLGAECVFASVGLGGQVACYFFREGNRIKLHFSLLGEGGLSFGAGVGLMVRSGKDRNRGWGMNAGYDAEIMGGGFAALDFEIPINASGMLDFITNNYELLFGGTKEEAAKSLVKDYDHAVGPYLTGALTQAHLRARGEASAKLSIKRSGNEARSGEAGGNETAEMNSTNTDRPETSHNVRSERFMEKIRAIMKGRAFSQPQNIGMGDLLALIGEFIGIGMGAEAAVGMNIGTQFEHDAKGRDRIWLFFEGEGLARLKLPLPVPLGISGGIGIRVGYTRQKVGAEYEWRPQAPEAYVFNGNLDDYEGGAYELSFPAKESEKKEDRGARERVIALLRKVRLTKRFMIDVGHPKLQRRLRVLTGVSALATSDGKAFGVKGSLAATMELDLDRLNIDDPIISAKINDLQDRMEMGDLNDPLDWISTALQNSLNPETGEETGIGSLLVGIIQPDTIKSCVFHAQLGIGGAVSGKAGAHLKFQLDLTGKAGLVWEKDLGDKVREWLNRERMSEEDKHKARYQFVCSIIGNNEKAAEFASLLI